LNHQPITSGDEATDATGGPGCIGGDGFGYLAKACSSRRLFEMPVQPAPKQTRLPAPVRRAKILEAAFEVFSERGYVASVGEIARAAGVTRTVLYYYFPAKNDLFIAVLDSLLTEVVKHVAPAAAEAVTHEERARAVVGALIGFADDNPRAWKILFTQGEDTDPEVAEVLASMEEMGRQTALLLFSAEIEELGVDLDDPRARVMAELLFGGAVQVMRWWSRNPECPRPVVEQAVFDVIWHGVAGITQVRGTV
jgi:AcrR family transcriptional regulator